MRVDDAIDCDFHPTISGIDVLLPFMEGKWRDQFLSRGIDGLGLNSYAPGIPTACRPDWRVKEGQSDMEATRANLLDRFGVKIAICNPLYGVQGLQNEYLATALACAINNWVRAEWLDKDDRFRASIIIPAQAPEAAVAEIERCAADRRFVQVLVLSEGEIPLGRRFYWPIYEAAQRHGLPIGIHAGSTYHHPPTAAGWPSYHIEEVATQFVAFEAQLLSLITQGVFKEFPSLKIVLLESGFTWVPPFLWGADSRWRAMRTETPWVDRSPTDLVHEHIRFTTRPLDTPPRPELLARVIEQLGSEELLLFSSDYPHHHFDGDDILPSSFPANQLQALLRQNALKTYSRLAEMK